MIGVLQEGQAWGGVASPSCLLTCAYPIGKSAVPNARKLLGRLNPLTARFDIGRGGKAEFSPETIAGALGSIPSGLGRELLCHVWWPNGAMLTRDQLGETLRDAQLSEWMDRAGELQAAQLALHIAGESNGRGNSHREVSRAKSDVDAAKSRMWPALGPQSRYKAIRQSILAELCGPGVCIVCNGSGQQMRSAEKCLSCGGTGMLAVSGRRRAETIGCDHKAYERTWKPPYEWLYAHCVDAESAAARALAAHLD